MIYLQLVVIPLLALLFRLRGGWYGEFFKQTFPWWGDVPARAFFWAIGPGLIVLWLTHNAIAALGMMLLNYGDATIGWYGSLALGDMKDGQVSFGRDFWVMALRGVIWAVPFAAAFAWAEYHWYPLFLSAALCPLIYQGAWFLSPITPEVGGRNNIPYGEIGFGALLGINCWLVTAIGAN